MPGMRPKKPRFLDGVQLADNLYTDPKKRPGHYSYIRPDGTKRTFRADTVAEANRMAEEANAMRDVDLPVERKRPARDHLAYHIPLYISYMQHLNPGLKKKRSWENRRYALKQLPASFEILQYITHDRIVTWWDDLTYHQQKARMAEFRRFFNWLMRQGLVPKLQYNPFTTADDRPRLLLKEKPKKKRMPLTQAWYSQIHARAGEMDYECLQIAMGISRYTTLREGDIVKLKFDEHVIDGRLQVVVSKSEAQRGSARAVRLQWTLTEHPVLKALIDRARELSLIHKRCPYIISHKPRRRAWNAEKTHHYQVTVNRLSTMFREVRDACGIESTAFHEVRGLSMTLYRKAGYTNEEIQGVAGHEDVRTTVGYQDGNALPYKEVDLRLAE